MKMKRILFGGIMLLMAFFMASCDTKDSPKDNNDDNINNNEIENNNSNSNETGTPVTDNSNLNNDENTSTNDSGNQGTGAGDSNEQVTPSNPVWDSVNSSSSISIKRSAGHLESAYIEWTGVSSAISYNVYYKEENASSYSKIDTQLIRLYSDHLRADVVGLRAGNYTLKIAPVFDDGEGSDAATANVTVAAHDRSGYAFVDGTSSGAYNNDGSLRSNANVIYVTQKTKDSVSLTSGTTTFTGVQNIIAAHKKTITTPLCVRFVGNITDPSVLEKGDLLIDGATNGITLEGIGEDSVINGFGIRIKGSSNVEVRNLATMNCNREEGDNIGLQQENNHIWVHNCDFFYGDAGSDADQVKGDGALDTKLSTYVTHSYNHFWDSGKSNLQGMKAETVDNKITYHHNWYDHSDSRHPRVRTCTVHVYNNFFDGNAKYGIGATTGASIFVENNYFRNCKNPMLSSKQGTDALGEGTFSGEDGGIIKAYGNHIEGGNEVIYYSSSNLSFDAYLASSRDEVIPSTVITVAGGTAYNNFDTASDFYAYTVDTPQVAKEKVMTYAGRINGGDLKYEFDDAVEDSNYAVIAELKSKIANYKSSIVQILGEEANSDNPGDSTEEESTGGNSSSVIEGSIVYNVSEFENNGNEYFTIVGNMKDKTYDFTYGDYVLTKALKLEGSTFIKFTTDKEMTITLVITAPSKRIKIDDTSYTANSDGVLTITIAAGSHEITKGDSTELLLIILA